MKLLGFVILVLFGAVFLTHLALDNPGYVLIAFTPWSIEMSLAVFAGLLIAGSAALYALWQLLLRLWRTPREVERWRALRRNRRAREALIGGLVSLAEGNWVKAEKSLLSGVRDGEHPLLNHLASAVCAQQQGLTEKRDEYLAQAYRATPEARLAIGMIQAQLQYAARQHERALATLTELRVFAPRHPYVLNRLARLYRALRDWESLANLIPELRRRHALAAEEIGALELEAHRELLRLTPPASAADVLKRAWNAVPEALRLHPELIALYARHLIAQGEMDACEALLSTAIERNWNGELVRLYGQVRAANPAAQFETAEAWLQLKSDDPDLLLCLGRLAQHNQLSAKARIYLERCAARNGPVECFTELSALLETLGERDRALEYCRRALARHTAAPAASETAARAAS